MWPFLAGKERESGMGKEEKGKRRRKEMMTLTVFKVRADGWKDGLMHWWIDG